MPGWRKTDCAEHPRCALVAPLQVLGLHLPVMKLCVGSLSCVIENRLESEEKALESQLLGGRGARGAGGTSVGGPSEKHQRPAPLVPVTAPLPAPSTAPSASAEKSSRAAGVVRNAPGVGASVSRDDLPLSHTWHGSGSRQTVNAGPLDNPRRGGQGGGPAGARGNGRGSTRVWGVSKGSRDLDTGSVTPTGTDATSAGTGRAGAGTPTKAVKFLLGRKRTNGASTSPVAKGGTGAGGALLGGGQDSSGGGDSAEEAPDPQGSVMNVIVQTRMWADYFNNSIRCWEALLDPFR